MDTNRYDIIFFDVGHTLCWPDLQGMANMATAILGQTVTQADLARGDRVARRAINRDVRTYGHASTVPPSEGEVPYSMREYYGNLIVHGIAHIVSHWPQPDGRFQRVLIPAWWEHQRTKNWFTVLGPDVVETLDLLKRDGWRLGIISNSEGRVHELLTNVGIRGFFDVLVDSGVEGVSKPDPAIFRLATARAGVDAPRCLYVGDQPDVDVKAARAAGMDVIHYDPGRVFSDFAEDGVVSCTDLVCIADGTLALHQILADTACRF